MQPVTLEYALTTAFRRWGLTPKRMGDELHGPCPKCGGVDRFAIFLEDGGIWCRQCDLRGWLDDDQRRFRPDATMLARQKEREELERRHRIELVEMWARGHAVGYCQGYHDAMLHSAQALSWWKKKGVSEWAIQTYKLGYCPSRRIQAGDGYIEVPAYTIPIRRPSDGAIINVHYRLDLPPDLEKDIGKYRGETLPGDESLPAAAFYSNRKVSGPAIVVEGAIKAMVLFEKLERKVQVVGLPSNVPSHFLIEELKGFGPLWITLDPGCAKQAERISDILGKGMIVELPWKPDDAFTQHGMSVAEFREYCRNGRIAH